MRKTSEKALTGDKPKLRQIETLAIWKSKGKNQDVERIGKRWDDFPASILSLNP